MKTWIRKAPRTKTVFLVSTEKQGTWKMYRSIDAILTRYPEMNQKGILSVLNGKQKSHVGYHILKAEVEK